MPFREATVAWALAAHAELAETATGYGHFITVNDLAERVQQTSGVYTDTPTRMWMDAILRKVARRCHNAGEPPLTALCVRQNHTVGDTYRYVLELAALPIPDDLELHAAYARWQCYQHFGAGMPADFTIPPLTPKVAARRGKTAQTRRSAPQAEAAPRTAAMVTEAQTELEVDAETETEPQVRERVCEQCFIQLPASGTCHYCG
ncbi:hypothetical protein IT779_11730 [Nocardia sp. NEAU-351]|uniref:Uncharacterized protein n=1 Tax=Nocardia bovistercoris TaxID=2785916 RepID=A0A931I8S6_9NOCA|nr:hypothetical protein [Nocardia bovistercoris]